MFGQNLTERKFNVNYENENFINIIKDLEVKTGAKIYYKPSDLATFNSTLALANSPLETILNTLFSGKGLFYTVRGEAIFITKDVKIDELSFRENKASTNDIEVARTVGANTSNKLYEVGVRSGQRMGDSAKVVGYLFDEVTKKPIADALVWVPNKNKTVRTDKDGYYEINLPLGPNTLAVKVQQLKEARRQLLVLSNGRLDIEVREHVELLKQVDIVSNKASSVKTLEMGVNRLTIKTIKQVPSVFGEADVLRVVMTLPGVQSVGEASTGFNVRGGSVDQNLVLLDNSTIYNPAHFFGFFSAFNPELVKDLQLYKSTVPEKFGGRLSSVLEVSNRKGDKSKFTGSAGIGVITSRFNIEGPIKKDKTSFILGGRTTYSNWLLKLLPQEYENSSASFYDGNLGLSHSFNKNSELYIMAYRSKDNFSLNSDTSYSYSNNNASIEWKRIFSNKLQASFIATTDNYNYNVGSDGNPVNAYQLKFNINQTNLKANFIYSYNSKHTLNFGASTTMYRLKPGSYEPQGDRSLVTPDIVEPEKALESAIFIGDEYKVSNQLSLNIGFRYSLYNYLGPQSVSYYVEDRPKTDLSVIDVKNFGNNDFIKTYHYPEVRLAARYAFVNDFSIKASYNTQRQYIHLLSNTTTISPTDIWKLSDPNIRPQSGSQVSLGLYKNFASQTIETSIEGYYKKLNDYLDYKSGATLILNDNIEQDVINTKGKAYGVEVFLKKNTGKLNGWLSYTYSRTLLKMDDPSVGPLVNEGAYYPANYDKPHAFNFTGNYKLKQRYHFSLNFTYSTGRPITLPIAKYYYGGSERVYYSDRNAYRIPDYLRVDASFNIEGNHKLKQLTHSSWTIGVYNLTGRRNIFSTFFTQESGAVNGYNLSIFASAIPFINYNIKF